MLRQMMRVACVATLLLAGSRAEAATITLTSSAAAVNVGEEFAVDISASDVNLGAFELTIGFEPAHVTLLEEPEYFDFLGAPASLQIPAIGLDFVEVDETSFVSVPELLALQGTAPGNSFLLGRLQFRAETAGVADFGFLFDYLSDVTGQNQIIASLEGTSVTIGTPQGDTVPEPSTMMLVGVGLAAAARLGRFRRVTRK